MIVQMPPRNSFAPPGWALPCQEGRLIWRPHAHSHVSTGLRVDTSISSKVVRPCSNHCEEHRNLRTSMSHSDEQISRCSQSMTRPHWDMRWAIAQCSITSGWCGGEAPFWILSGHFQPWDTDHAEARKTMPAWAFSGKSRQRQVCKELLAIELVWHLALVENSESEVATGQTKNHALEHQKTCRCVRCQDFCWVGDGFGRSSVVGASPRQWANGNDSSRKMQFSTATLLQMTFLMPRQTLGLSPHPSFCAPCAHLELRISMVVLGLKQSRMQQQTDALSTRCLTKHGTPFPIEMITEMIRVVTTLRSRWLDDWSERAMHHQRKAKPHEPVWNMRRLLFYLRLHMQGFLPKYGFLSYRRQKVLEFRRSAHWCIHWDVQNPDRTGVRARVRLRTVTFWLVPTQSIYSAAGLADAARFTSQRCRDHPKSASTSLSMQSMRLEVAHDFYFV